MAHGGARKGAGRPKGSANRLSAEAREAALVSGVSPLDYMLSRLRDETLDHDIRMDAAKAAAPYIHAKLAAVEHSGGVMFSHEEMLDELDGSRDSGQASSEG